MDILRRKFRTYLLMILSAVMLSVLPVCPAMASEGNPEVTVEESTDGTTEESTEGGAEESTEETSSVSKALLELLARSELTCDVSEVVYSGKKQTPAVKLIVTDDKGVQTDVTERFVMAAPVYQNNVNAGNASVKVTVTGYYAEDGSKAAFDKACVKETSFAISQKSLKGSAITLSTAEYTYNGSARKPSVKAVLDGKTLVNNTDFTVSYKNNTNAGTASVTVKGKGNYCGSVSASFTIKKMSISKASGIASLSKTVYAYDAKAHKPSVTVKAKLATGTAVLKKDRDYSISYSKNCTAIGSKTILVKGAGNYTGSYKLYFKIVPEKASAVKVTKRTTDALTVTCKAAKDSKCQYEFWLKRYNSKADKWELQAKKKTAKNTAAFTGLKAGTYYRVYARIYKNVTSGDKTTAYAGSWSNVLKTSTTPAKTVITYLNKTGSKSFKVSWSAVNSATGYEVQYSRKSDFSGSKTVVVKGRTTTSKTVKDLNSTGNYYVRVRAYRIVADQTYRGSWSSKMSTNYSNVYASYKTTFNTGNRNRVTNLKLACKAINGKVLAKDETFSFNAIVGKRTAAKGYKEAIVYSGGRETGGIGGGICQVATTLFNAALKANFQIVERHQHSLTVHYCPLGYDAAIAWGSKNLRFKNNTGVPVKVQATISGGTLTVKYLTSVAKTPPKVTTKVTVRKGVYTLKRYVNGKCNYTTTSNYLDN